MMAPTLLLENTRFGTITYAPGDVLRFPQGLIGFDSCSRFLLVSTSENGTFQWLQSLDVPSLAFLVTRPQQYVATYEPKVKSFFSAPAKVDPSKRLVLTTVSIPKGRPEEMSINLAGPIVIDLHAKLGRQIILEDEAYTTRHRVFAKASDTEERVAA